MKYISYVEEIKQRGFLVAVGVKCSWYSYNTCEYLIFHFSGKYLEFRSSIDADYHYEQSEL